MHQLMRYFTYEHLPQGPLKETSIRFHFLAADLDETLPDGAEKTVALRTLLEAKDAGVRAALDIKEG